jgi:hypothetical protein
MRITRKADMPTDHDPRDTPLEPPQAQDDDDTLSLVDFIDSVDRTAFRRALEHRFNYYPLPRTD